MRPTSTRRLAPPIAAAGTLSVMARLQLVVVAVILGWGVLAFGAVYPWAYGPLAIACAISGVVALASPRGRRAVPGAVALALTAVVAAGLLQEIRVPAAFLQRISPAAAPLLTQYDVAFGGAPHALSIDPGRTATGLVLLAALGVFWIGLSGLLDGRMTIRVAQIVVALGGVVAIIALAGVADDSGRVYGLWQPQFRGSPFGPFVNRNHFAGWMLMSASVGFGYFTSLLAQASRTAGRSWRSRVIWLSTSDATGLIAVGAALMAMTVSIVLSMSRSGIACLAFALAVMGCLAGRRMFSGWARRAYFAGLLLFAVTVIGAVGVANLSGRFATVQDDSLAGRVATWRDAAAIARQFPVAGTGLNTFGVGMLFYQSTHLNEIYLEAHNDYLQLAVEGGLLMGVPALLLIFFTVRDVRRRFREGDRRSSQRWIRVGAVVGMLSVGMQEAADFSLQMPGTAALFCVLAAIALHRRSPVAT